MSCGQGTLWFGFDQTNPQAIQWARLRSAQLVTAISDDARAAIRRLVGEAFESGIPPRELAGLIRNTIGLTERDALAVMNRQLKLMAQGMSPERAAALAKKYADQLHRARALMIARTETMAASNEGQQELWRQAVDAKQLSKSMRKQWIATGDERTCPTCGPLDGTTVPVLEDFPLGNPPAHPLCRCTIGLSGGAGKSVSGPGVADIIKAIEGVRSDLSRPRVRHIERDDQGQIVKVVEEMSSSDGA